MKYEIIEMTLDYYDKLVEFWKNVEGIYNNPIDDSFDSMKLYLKRNPKLNFIIVENEKIIGTIKCGHDGRRGFLHHLAIDKNYRKKRLSKKLVNLCLKELKKEGIKKCNIFVEDYNKAGLEYWKYNGWKELTYDYRTLQKKL